MRPRLAAVRSVLGGRLADVGQPWDGLAGVPSLLGQWRARVPAVPRLRCRALWRCVMLTTRNQALAGVPDWRIWSSRKLAKSAMLANVFRVCCVSGASAPASLKARRHRRDPQHRQGVSGASAPASLKGVIWSELRVSWSGVSGASAPASLKVATHKAAYVLRPLVFPGLRPRPH